MNLKINTNIYSNWPTEDGRILKITEMETSHLKNCAYKIVRNNWRIHWLQLFIKELNKRKENEVPDEIMCIFKMNTALE